jgi:hypothetical protein
MVVKLSMHFGKLRFHHLTLALAVTAQVACPQNKALKLDGNGSYVELPPNIFRDLTQATVELWAKWEGFQQYSRVFESGAGWQSLSLFNHGNTPDLRFNLYPRSARNDPSLAYKIQVPNLLHSNEWIHLAAVSGPGGMRLYVNGVMVGQHTNAASFADINAWQTNWIGRGLTRNPTDRDFRGEIDEIRVWNHRRNSTQIRANMNRRLTGKEDGLTHLWNFDDGTANDSSSSGHHGKLMGNARIVITDLAFASEVATAPPPPAFLPATNSSLTNGAVVAAALNAPSTNAATWWIAAALSALVALLAWLVLMLRRSGLGAPKLLLPASTPAALPPASGTAVQPDVKERALAELTDFAKQSLVQGLYSQRAALLETHQKAQQELAELEARVVALRLPERIQAYEKRIAELEGELASRSDELRELTLATLQVLREKLEEEKQKEAKPGGRVN